MMALKSKMRLQIYEVCRSLFRLFVGNELKYLGLHISRSSDLGIILDDFDSHYFLSFVIFTFYNLPESSSTTLLQHLISERYMIPLDNL